MSFKEASERFVAVGEMKAGAHFCTACQAGVAGVCCTCNDLQGGFTRHFMVRHSGFLNPTHPMPAEPNPISPSRRVTLKDLARETGLHVSSVSRAMGNSPLIPGPTRQLVHEAAARLGYHRDPMLQALVSYRKTVTATHYHGTLAWLLSDQHQDKPAYDGLRGWFEVASKAAAPLGYKLEEIRIGDVAPAKVLRQLAARGITGILFPPQLRPGKRLKIDLSGFAAVRIGETLVEPAINSVGPHHFRNIMLMLARLRAAGWRRIGFYMPKVIDSRSFGAFSAAFWRWQQDLPEQERIEIGLPDDFDPQHFLDWFKKHQPTLVIGLRHPLHDWLAGMKIPPPPVLMPSSMSDDDERTTHVEEDWPAIYLAAVRMLDSMLRHGERGVPARPRRILIEGTWVPAKHGKAGKRHAGA